MRLDHQQEVELDMTRMMKLMLAMMFAATIASSALAVDTVWLSTSNTDPGAAPVNGINPVQNYALTPHVLYIWSTATNNLTPETTVGGTPGQIPSSWSTLTTPDPATAAYFSVDAGVNGTATPGVITITQALLSNQNVMSGASQLSENANWVSPYTAVPVTRWYNVSSFTAGLDPTHIPADGQSVHGLNATTIPLYVAGANSGTNVDPNNHLGLPASGVVNGTAQPGYNAARNAYLVGEIDYTNALV